MEDAKLEHTEALIVWLSAATAERDDLIRVVTTHDELADFEHRFGVGASIRGPAGLDVTAPIEREDYALWLASLFVTLVTQEGLDPNAVCQELLKIEAWSDVMSMQTGTCGHPALGADDLRVAG